MARFLTTTESIPATLATTEGNPYPVSPFPSGGGPTDVGAIADIIWRPGAGSAGNVVATWGEVQALVDAVEGACRIYVDSTLAPANIPPGTWKGYGSVSLQALPDSFVTVQDGATLQNYLRLYNIAVSVECKTAPAFSFSPFLEFFIEDFASITFAAGALVPAIQVTAAMGELTIRTSLGVLQNAVGATVPVVNVQAGGTLIFYAQNASQANQPVLFAGNEIGGPVGSTLFWENDASVPPFASPFFHGTLNAVPTDDAANMSYEPAVLANWSGTAPTSVANALDRIAAKITPIP